MPGIHLNDTEKKLAKRWDCDGMSANTLKGISIHGGGTQPHAELRGMSSLDIDFRYPVTVLCGKNGAGKTTILSLAALGFHGVEGFSPRGAGCKSSRGGEYYTFSDFFYKGPQDSDCKGISIEWRYYKKPPVKIQKRSEKWMHYERRPPRATQFLGPIRIASAIEQRVLRSHFTNGKNWETRSLNEEYLGYLSEILGRPYDQAGELVHKGYCIRACKARGEYSSFNMGAGEDAIIDLLSYLQGMPEESLCVIEEIELGIYPEALVKLAQVIQKIALKKKMQFIISSHSQFFIDQLPRRSRILLQRYGDTCSPIYEPTTRYAIGNMSESFLPELVIYCEDRLSEQILSLAVSNSTRQRINIIPIGSKDEFKKVYDIHQKLNPRMKHLFVWDGDVKDSEVKNIFAGVDKFNYFFLHEDGTPERNLISKLSESGVSVFARAFEFSNENEASEMLDYLRSLKDPHDFAFQLITKTNLEEQVVVSKVIDCYLSICPNEKAQIERLIVKCLSFSGGAYLEEHNRTTPATV